MTFFKKELKAEHGEIVVLVLVGDINIARSTVSGTK